MFHLLAEIGETEKMLNLLFPSIRLLQTDKIRSDFRHFQNYYEKSVRDHFSVAFREQTFLSKEFPPRADISRDPEGKTDSWETFSPLRNEVLSRIARNF